MSGPCSMTKKRAAKKRTRSGCLPCRGRRRKCDEARPSCRNCVASGDECRWGVKVSFHPSRSLLLSPDDSAMLLEIEARRALEDTDRDIPETSGLIIDDTESILQSYHGHGSRSSSPETEHEATFVEDVSLNEIAHTPFLASPTITTSRSHLLINALESQHASPVWHGVSPVTLSSNQRSDLEGNSPATRPPFHLGQGVSRNASPLPTLKLPVSKQEQAYIMAAYLRETGTWCETTDSEMHFVKNIHHMMRSEAFVGAALALSSRQLDTLKRQQSQATLELYQYTIQQLIRQDPSEADASILAACTLLCVYEMMASSVSEWRRHLKGCAGLLKSRGWDGSSKGIIKTCFWAFARIDIWAAFIIGETTLIPTHSWVKEDCISSAAVAANTDDYCNLAILFFANIVNLLALGSGLNALPSYEYKKSVKRLWQNLLEWWENRPTEVQPLLRAPHGESGPFPVTIFTQSSSICGNTFYHAGSILLLRTGLVSESDCSDTEQHDPIWHAREIGGISTWNISHANWVNHLQPLYIAGLTFTPQSLTTKNMTGIASHQLPGSRCDQSTFSDLHHFRDEYASEKIALLKQLSRIERETGWKTSDRSAELRQMWGLS